MQSFILRENSSLFQNFERAYQVLHKHHEYLRYSHVFHIYLDHQIQLIHKITSYLHKTRSNINTIQSISHIFSSFAYIHQQIYGVTLAVT